MISYTSTNGIIINVIMCVVSIGIILLSMRGIRIESSKWIRYEKETNSAIYYVKTYEYISLCCFIVMKKSSNIDYDR